MSIVAKQVTTCSNQVEAISRNIYNGYAEILQEFAGELVEGQLQDGSLEEVRALVDQLVQAHQENTALQQSLGQFKMSEYAEIVESTDGSVSQYIETLKRIQLEELKERVARHPFHVGLEAAIEEARKNLVDSDDEMDVEEDADADMVVAKTKQSTICPISQTTLVNPQMSTRCGHTFSHDVIHAWLGQNAGGQKVCPVAGCNQIISAATLVLNKKMVKQLKKEAANAKGQDDDVTVLL
ncbi:hypothetical protein MIR68_001037 [Amoeboaphelidium protococcarum]|nr:hypothetical protein MIR68_001037 [Amoeboaphelidium protococcarum]